MTKELHKKDKNITPRCPHDGHLMRRDVRSTEVAYKGESAMVNVPGWYCDHCGEGILVGREVKESDRVFQQLKARAEGLIEPDDIKHVRKKLKLSQEVAGEIIGGGPRAFQKYEKGDLLPSRALSSALILLDHFPKGLEILIKHKKSMSQQHV